MGASNVQRIRFMWYDSPTDGFLRRYSPVHRALFNPSWTGILIQFFGIGREHWYWQEILCTTSELTAANSSELAAANSSELAAANSSELAASMDIVHNHTYVLQLPVSNLSWCGGRFATPWCGPRFDPRVDDAGPCLFALTCKIRGSLFMYHGL